MVKLYCYSVGNFITSLAQLEWVKSELNRMRYEFYKFLEFTLYYKSVSYLIYII
jgi:hypothetical protein